MSYKLASKELPDTWSICGIGVSTYVLVYKDDISYDIAAVWDVAGTKTWRTQSGKLLKNVTHWKQITPP